ncbi:MAG TPA: class I SAM-dependent methyltransferase [Pyrinomonadaceae bacterium]|nr:class I SAM-dependent methyltransferase [Pyrinomonadaceae bacterium]
MNQDKVWDYFQTEGLEKFSLSVPRLNFLLRQAIKIAAGSSIKVLNIGVGDAWLEKQCIARGWEVYALDPIAAAISMVQAAGGQGQVGHIESIPFADDFFDVVFCSEIIEHLSREQIQQGLDEVTRILKRGGVLLGTVPFNENLFEGRVVCPDCGSVFHRIGHQQSFDLSTLLAVFPKSLELEKVKTQYFCDWPTLNWKGKVIALAKKALLVAGVHGVNENIFFAARKV